MKKTANLMMNFIKSAVFQQPLDRSFLESLSEEDFKKLYALSKSHDLAHLIGAALGEGTCAHAGTTANQFQRETCMAVYRFEQIQYEFDALCKLLEESEIAYLPLKGSVIRRYYPEPWLRTSCDIDILIHEQDLAKAKQAVTETLGYQFVSHGRHDVGFFSPSGIHFELHYTLIENDVMQRIEKPLENIWDYAVLTDGYSFQYALKDEMFYYYHVAHMAKHYVQGGCGIRPFLDLWILNNRIDFDKLKREELLQQGGLLTFAREAEYLSKVWFENEPRTPLIEQMEEYLLGAGVYGNLSNRVVANQVKRGGKIKYALSKIWLPYENLKYYYPGARKRKWFVPFYQVRRWCRVLFGKGRKHAIKELKVNSSVSDEKKNEIKELFKRLDLNV